MSTMATPSMNGHTMSMDGHSVNGWPQCRQMATQCQWMVLHTQVYIHICTQVHSHAHTSKFICTPTQASPSTLGKSIRTPIHLRSLMHTDLSAYPHMQVHPHQVSPSTPGKSIRTAADLLRPMHTSKSPPSLSAHTSRHVPDFCLPLFVHASVHAHNCNCVYLTSPLWCMRLFTSESIHMHMPIRMQAYLHAGPHPRMSIGIQVHQHSARISFSYIHMYII